MATVVGKNSRGGLKKVGKNTKTSGSSSGSSSAKMKEVGARYSTTNRSGETTFYKSSRDADVGGSGGFYKTDARGTAIPMEALQPTSVPNIPIPASMRDVGNLAGGNNAGLASMLGGLGYTLDEKGQFVSDPSMGDNATLQAEANTGLLAGLKSYLGMQSEPESKTGLYTDTYGINPRQAQRDYANERKNVANQTATLNSIIASSQAEQLKLEGQGRGQTSGFIGGEQARINREAAIQALPVQAALASSQANLEEATRHLDNLFKLQSEDADAKYAFQNKMVDAVYNFATTAQQNILTAKMADKKAENDQKQNNINYLRQLSAEARDNGNSNVLAQLGYIDPGSATFEADVARIAQGIVKPVSAVKLDTQFNANGDLVNMQTGEIISSAGRSSGGTLDGKPQTQTQAKVNGFADRLLEAESILKDSNKFGSFFAVGADLPNYLKTEDRQEFEQAQRNFINAVLRTESGAVIADSEFENAAQQYFPQRGDSAGTLLQKAANRNTVISNFYREANVPRPDDKVLKFEPLSIGATGALTSGITWVIEE
jgi:hypothetical protein